MSISRAVVRLFVAAIVVVGLGSCSVPGIGGGGAKMTITAEFDNANGLYVGNSVDILGISVGKVTAIDNTGPFVSVEMEVDAIDIPADVEAVTVSTSILTDRHIELTPAYTEGPTLKTNDRIGIDRTRTPVEFDRILRMVENLSLELAGDGEGEGPVADMIALSASITEGNGAPLRDALGRLEEALRLSEDGGVQSQEDFSAIVDNLASLSEAAANNDETIRAFGSGIASLSEFLASERLGTGDTGAQLNSIMAEMTTLLEENRGSIATTVGASETMTKALSDYRRELAEVLDVTPMLLDNVWLAIDHDAKALRVHGLLDKVVLDGQAVKEICNVLGLRQLGCATGTLADFGPDFGASSILAALTEQAGR